MWAMTIGCSPSERMPVLCQKRATELALTSVPRKRLYLAWVKIQSPEECCWRFAREEAWAWKSLLRSKKICSPGWIRAVPLGEAPHIRLSVIASGAMELDEEFMGDIVFDGLGPFMLPVATAVGAISARDRVEISLRIQTTPKRQETILITVSVNQAVELAALLTAASGDALRPASSS
jgi:hypothetical protein